jgi:hypothetical protein
VAGFYPDVPGFRFEYDRDGSIAVSYNNLDASYHYFSTADAQELNDEDGAAVSPVAYWYGVGFPELRDLTGIFTRYDGIHDGNYATLETSANTTNGVDGTWTVRSTAVPENRRIDVPTGCRTSIFPISVPAIKGVRVTPTFEATSNAYALHLYGHISLTENPDRLVLCDGTGAVVTDGAYFDFGDAPRGTTATKTFRIRNNSASLTAHSVTVSFQTLFDASPTLAGQFQYDFGAGWVTTGNIGSLGPGAVSSTIQVRRNTSASAAGGPWQSRVVAVPASMT